MGTWHILECIWKHDSRFSFKCDCLEWFWNVAFTPNGYQNIESGYWNNVTTWKWVLEYNTHWRGCGNLILACEINYSHTWEINQQFTFSLVSKGPSGPCDVTLSRISCVCGVFTWNTCVAVCVNRCVFVCMCVFVSLGQYISISSPSIMSTEESKFDYQIEG
jgi:hypothetical protein